jgi:selenide,water dikinase
VLVSSNTVDDAGVYLLDEDRALVCTVDFFTPVVDDPVEYGRIAAANSVSDVYAMGGTPLVALNVLCFPDEDLSPDVMAAILTGAQEKMTEAGVVTIGGHSVKDRELKFGCAVIGTVDPQRVVTNAAARPGDVLVLTKPIGVGVLATALKNDRLPANRLAEITELMGTLNKAACEAMLAAGAKAATDVTGFGLAGHAIEMAQASEVTFDIEVAGVPLVDGALEMLRSGVAPGGLFTNQEYYRRFIQCDSDADTMTVGLVYDPQTSGGLLIALAEDRLDDLERALSRAGAAGSWVIGRVLPKGARPLILS